MPMEEARLCLLLQAVPGIEDAARARLLSHCGSPGIAAERWPCPLARSGSVAGAGGRA